MRSKNSLYILYRFTSAESLENKSTYDVVLMFSESGEIFSKDYGSLFAQDNKYSDKEELLEMSHQVLASKQFASVFLLSVNDFNVGIETCHDLSSFKEIFKRYGQLISESEDNEGNLFGKFF